MNCKKQAIVALLCSSIASSQALKLSTKQQSHKRSDKINWKSSFGSKGWQDGLELEPFDHQYDPNNQLNMRAPLIYENRQDAYQGEYGTTDVMPYYNPDKYFNDLGNYVQTEVESPYEPYSTKYVGSFGSKGYQDGLELPPVDHQYDPYFAPYLTRKPLILQNRNDDNDLIDTYNPDKYFNDYGNYAQVEPSYKGSFGSKGWQDGLELPPFDHQYDHVHAPTQMRKPLILENRNDQNDLINTYNPNKYENDYGNYAQHKLAQAQQGDFRNYAQVSGAANQLANKPQAPSSNKSAPPLANNDTPQTVSSLKYKGSFGSKGWQDGLELPPFDHQYDVPYQMRKPLIYENWDDKNDIISRYNPGKYQNSEGNY